MTKCLVYMQTQSLPNTPSSKPAYKHSWQHSWATLPARSLRREGHPVTIRHSDTLYKYIFIEAGQKSSLSIMHMWFIRAINLFSPPPQAKAAQITSPLAGVGLIDGWCDLWDRERKEAGSKGEDELEGGHEDKGMCVDECVLSQAQF